MYPQWKTIYCMELLADGRIKLQEHTIEPSEYTNIQLTTGFILVPKNIQINMITGKESKEYDFTHSNTTTVIVDDETLTGFTYSELLKSIYLKIDNGVSIIKSSILNISTLTKNINDFIYLDKIGISVQIPKSINTIIAEILNQCSAHNLSIMLRLKIHKSGLIVQINQVATQKNDKEIAPKEIAS